MNTRKAQEARSEASELRAELDGLPEVSSASAGGSVSSYASDLLTAALTGEPADETFVRLDNGSVARVSHSDDSEGIDVEKSDTDATRAALSVSEFNEAAEGVRLSTKKTGDGVAIGVGETVGEDVVLPGVTASEPESSANTSNATSERIAALERKRDMARDMEWSAAAQEAQAKIDDLRENSRGK